MEVNMYRKRHKRGKRLASVFLTVALITATVPVQAAEFGTPDSFEEIFSTGEADSCITDTENTLPAASDSEKVTASELSPTPTVTSTPEGTPALIDTPTPSFSSLLSSTPSPSVTPSPSPTPTINPEKEVMLRFIDGEGNECEQLRTVMSWGESLILPNVPDTDAPDMWKLEKNEKLGDAITLKGGDILTLKKGESWNLFLEKGILNFYMQRNVRFPFIIIQEPVCFPMGFCRSMRQKTSYFRICHHLNTLIMDGQIQREVLL